MTKLAQTLVHAYLGTVAIIVAVIVIIPTAATAEPNQVTEGRAEQFPTMIPFFDLVSLPRTQQEIYIAELRKTLADIATSEAPGQVRLFVKNERPNLIRQLLFTEADAQTPYNPVDQGCDSGDGTQLLCVNNASGSNTQCLCAHSRAAFVKEYGSDYIQPQSQSSGCQMSGDESASQDITAHYVSVWVGGSQSCVTRSSYENVEKQIGDVNLRSSLHDAITDAERSKVFADKNNRLVRVDQIAAQIAAKGSAKNPINGTTTTHVYDQGTLSSESQKKALIALQASERVRSEAKLVGAADPTARLLAREQSQSSLKTMQAAADGAKRDGIKADEEAQRAILAAQKVEPAIVDAQLRDAMQTGVEAAGSSGQAGADLQKAAANLRDAQKQMNPATDDGEGLALKNDTQVTSAAADAAGKELLAKGQEVVNAAQLTLQNRVGSYAGDKQAKLKALQISLADLKTSLGRGAKDDIVKTSNAASEKVKEVENALNLPPKSSDHASGAPTAKGQANPAEAPVTCIKTGVFKCPNRKQKAGTDALDRARTALLAQDGEKSCIFGGSASTFGANVEGRGTKSRRGCAPKFDFDLKLGDTNYKLTCPAAQKNQRLVICNPVLYGYESTGDGTPSQAHCVDWTSMVTADCNYKYPLRSAKATVKSGAKTPAATTVSVSPIELLNNEKAQLEPGWETLSRAISRHCNSENFRQLNCSECEQISNRLSQMKVKATAGTCTWPSEIGTIRNSMKGITK